VSRFGIESYRLLLTATTSRDMLPRRSLRLVQVGQASDMIRVTWRILLLLMITIALDVVEDLMR